MSLTAYARSDIDAVKVSPDHGGCGQVHERPEGAEVFFVEDGCAEWLIANQGDQWAMNPATIPLTPDEETALAGDEQNRAATLAARGAGLQVGAAVAAAAQSATDRNAGLINNVLDRLDVVEQAREADRVAAAQALAAKDAELAEMKAALAAATAKPKARAPKAAAE
jgi:hypothetical protein